jgi:hypothetical protein
LSSFDISPLKHGGTSPAILAEEKLSARKSHGDEHRRLLEKADQNWGKVTVIIGYISQYISDI